MLKKLGFLSAKNINKKKKKICGNCFHYYENTCRRYPPKIIFAESNKEKVYICDDRLHYYTKWPSVKEDEKACGEFDESETNYY